MFAGLCTLWPTYKNSFLENLFMHWGSVVRIVITMCVCEKEGERERERDRACLQFRSCALWFHFILSLGRFSPERLVGTTSSFVVVCFWHLVPVRRRWLTPWERMCHTRPHQHLALSDLHMPIKSTHSLSTHTQTHAFFPLSFIIVVSLCVCVCLCSCAKLSKKYFSLILASLARTIFNVDRHTDTPTVLVCWFNLL